MSDLDDSFARLLGRQPTDAERQRLYRVRDALGLGNNDALWLVLMALEYYQGQYEKLPKAIAQTTSNILADFRTTADAVVAASAEAAKADLAKAVAAAAKDVARTTSAKQMWRWAAVCIVAAFLSFGAFGWVMHSSGKAAGYEVGYGAGFAEAEDEKAAASWANTPEGLMAYRFAQSGQLQRLASCTGRGWKVSRGYCFPERASDGVLDGWQMPNVKPRKRSKRQ